MKTLVILCCILFSTMAFADTLPDKKAAADLTAAVMEKVADGKATEGLDLLKPYVIIPESNFKAIQLQFKAQAPKVEKQFGKSVSVEYLKTETVGTSLMMIMYIQKFEKHIMRWSFYFYKPKAGWVINSFKTDDKLQDMFFGQ